MKWRYQIGIIICFVGWLFLSTKVSAGSGVIQFTTASDTVAKGDTVTVVCQVTSVEPFVDTSFAINYDERYLTFLTGGKKVKGGHGTLQVSSLGNTNETYKKTFSLQFKAKKKGTAVIGLEGQAQVTDAEGNHFSMSSNSMTVTVRKKGSVATAQPSETTLPQVTPMPVLSKENHLKSLQAHCLSFSPVFSSNQQEYEVTVDAATDNLYVSYAPADEKARVLLKGNEKLSEGVNPVIVRVIAENGEERQYKLSVYKESKEETKEREKEEKPEQKDVSFAITRKGNHILIKNAYEFEVLDPSSLTQIPSGYVQSSIEVQGIQIPAFTMEQDLDNNYLLLYLKGPSGKSTLYQYDREEKTLQRYTGSMTERVNRGGMGENKGISSISNYVLLGIIVILVILLLCMLIIMLKMAMQRKRKRVDF